MPSNRRFYSVFGVPLFVALRERTLAEVLAPEGFMLFCRTSRKDWVELVLERLVRNGPMPLDRYNETLIKLCKRFNAHRLEPLPGYLIAYKGRFRIQSMSFEVEEVKWGRTYRRYLDMWVVQKAREDARKKARKAALPDAQADVAVFVAEFEAIRKQLKKGTLICMNNPLNQSALLEMSGS